MHAATSTALVITALVASAYLLTHKGDRLYPGIAVVVAGIQALIVFKIMSISVTKFRIDVALAGALTVAGALCWHRSSTKGAIAASTAVTLIGLLELLSALKILR